MNSIITQFTKMCQSYGKKAPDAELKECPIFYALRKCVFTKDKRCSEITKQDWCDYFQGDINECRSKNSDSRITKYR